MTVIVREVSEARHTWYKSAAIGGIAGFVFCLLLLVHICYHYYQLFGFPRLCACKCRACRKSKTRLKSSPSSPLSTSLLSGKRVNARNRRKKRADARPYHLMIAYLLTSMLVCLFISLIRCNIITQLSISQFSDEQCAIGYFGNYALLSISKALMYNLFNYRIQTIFRDTQYAFHRALYLTMYVIPWWNVLFVLACLYIGQFEQTNHNLTWVLNTDTVSYVLFCGGTTKFRPAIKAFIIHSSVVELIMSLTLLFMFTKGLYNLYRTLLQQHVEEYMKVVTGDESDEFRLDDDGSKEAEDSGSNSLPERLRMKTVSSSSLSARKTVDRSLSSASVCEVKSIVRVVNLKNIIKKQTILVAIALVSSIVYWVLSMFYPSMSLQSCWDIMINASCIWLMFGTAEPVWNLLGKYCCCYICYTKV